MLTLAHMINGLKQGFSYMRRFEEGGCEYLIPVNAFEFNHTVAKKGEDGAKSRLLFAEFHNGQWEGAGFDSLRTGSRA